MAHEGELRLALEIEDASADLTPVRFRGTEEISTLYTYEIDVISPDFDVDLEALLLCKAKLGITLDNAERNVTGIIAEAQGPELTATGQYRYTLTLRPQLFLLTLSRQSQIYGSDDPVTAVDVIRREVTGSDALGHTIDTAAKIPLDCFDDSKLKGFSGSGGAYPERDHIVQYRESDFDFVSRLMEHYGIFYYFEATDKGEKLVLGDADTCFARLADAGPVPFRPGGGRPTDNTPAVTSFRTRHIARAKKVVLHDYNWRKPKDPLIAEATVKDRGTHGVLYDYGDHFKDDKEGSAFAKIRSQEQSCRAEQSHGVSTHLHFSSGTVFKFEDYFGSNENSEYIITQVQHSGGVTAYDDLGASSGRERGYSNRFTVLPHPANFRPLRRTKKPYVGGVITGHVDGAGEISDRAEINEHGEYKVRFRFDNARGVGDGKASRYVRKAEPYGGAKNAGDTGHQGMHFPLVKDTEVILSCINGDPDRPVIAGSVPNALAKSMVSRGNSTRNAIRTSSGIRMEFEDGASTAAATGAQHQTAPELSASQSIGTAALQHTAHPTAKSSEVSIVGDPGEIALTSDYGIYFRTIVPKFGQKPDGDEGQHEKQIFKDNLGSDILSYHRIGASDTGEKGEPIEKAYFDRQETQKTNGSAGTRLASPENGGSFDYINGDRVEWTTGNRDIIIGGNERKYSEGEREEVTPNAAKLSFFGEEVELSKKDHFKVDYGMDFSASFPPIKVNASMIPIEFSLSVGTKLNLGLNNSVELKGGNTISYSNENSTIFAKNGRYGGSESLEIFTSPPLMTEQEIKKYFDRATTPAAILGAGVASGFVSAISRKEKNVKTKDSLDEVQTVATILSASAWPIVEEVKKYFNTKKNEKNRQRYSFIRLDNKFLHLRVRADVKANSRKKDASLFIERDKGIIINAPKDIVFKIGDKEIAHISSKGMTFANSTTIDTDSLHARKDIQCNKCHERESNTGSSARPSSHKDSRYGKSVEEHERRWEEFDKLIEWGRRIANEMIPKVDK